MQIRSGKDMLNICHELDIKLHDLVLDYEKDRSGKTEEEILDIFYGQLQVMRESAFKALDDNWSGQGKIIGDEAKKMRRRYEEAVPVCGLSMARAVSFALSASEVNASMGRIVAAPTAGACGVLPGVLFSMAETHRISDEVMVRGLLAAGAIGIVIAKNATLSGAEGGCQAEVGAASAMGAAAAVEMLEGSPSQALNGAAIALKNMMGLICDPVAGLVEIPCANRNAIGTANALLAADMALAGIESIIPFDEVVDAMYRVGRMMPCSLRETAEGGVADTPTGRRLKEKIYGVALPGKE